MPLPLVELMAQMRALTAGKYAGNSKALGALGRVFTESAETNPNYFAVPKGAGGAPSADLADLSARHGLEVDPLAVEGNAFGVRAHLPATGEAA